MRSVTNVGNHRYRCATSDEGVGTREQLVIVPIQRSTKTRCSVVR
jgi:hypothetical protein